MQTRSFAHNPPSNKSRTWIEAAPKSWKIAHKPRLFIHDFRYNYDMNDVAMTRLRIILLPRACSAISLNKLRELVSKAAWSCTCVWKTIQVYKRVPWRLSVKRLSWTVTVQEHMIHEWSPWSSSLGPCKVEACEVFWSWSRSKHLANVPSSNFDILLMVCSPYKEHTISRARLYSRVRLEC